MAPIFWIPMLDAISWTMNMNGFRPIEFAEVVKEKSINKYCYDTY